MVLILKKGMNKKAIQNSLKKLQTNVNTGGFDATLFNGKLKRGLDGVDYQAKVRDEWN